MITCPSCNGAGGGEGFICSCEFGDSFGHIPCSVCNGTGTVPLETATKYTLGRKMAEERKSRALSLRAEAQRLGISVVDLSDIEHGREPKTKAGRAALEKRTEEMAALYAATA